MPRAGNRMYFTARGFQCPLQPIIDCARLTKLEVFGRSPVRSGLSSVGRADIQCAWSLARSGPCRRRRLQSPVVCRHPRRHLRRHPRRQETARAVSRKSCVFHHERRFAPSGNVQSSCKEFGKPQNRRPIRCDNLCPHCRLGCRNIRQTNQADTS